MIFRKKKEVPDISYDPEKQQAVLKCSICNREQVAGFRDMQTGAFMEVCLIRDGADLDQFKKRFGLTEVKKVY